MKIRYAVLAFSPISSRRSTLPRTPGWLRSPLLSASGDSAVSFSTQVLLQAAIPPSLYGGDYAGLSANFSPSTGSLIPVPEHLVPESLVEWGQVPSYLEVLTSEETKRDGDMISLERQTVTVLPEVGCGIDNLDTTKSKERAELALKESDSDSRLTIFADDVVALEYPLPPLREVNRKRVETAFSLGNLQRIRVLLLLNYSEEKFDVQSPVTIIVERQTSTTSSGGTIADGGGLDARTVTRLIGEDIRRNPFAEQRPLEAKQLQGWLKYETEESMEDSIKSISLPGNITVTWNEALPSKLDVSHMSNDASTRRVVRRQYDSIGNLVDNAEYWMEQKERHSENTPETVESPTN